MSGESVSLEVTVDDEPSSGLETVVLEERRPLGLRVDWIAWDSGFRGSGLELHDVIVAIDGQALALSDDPRQRSAVRSMLIGQHAERRAFAASRLGDGSSVVLGVQRKRWPGRGWVDAEVRGSLRAARAYQDAAGRSALGPGGPSKFERSPSGQPWGMWYDKRVAEWKKAVASAWPGAFDSRRALAAHLEGSPVVQALLASFPGPFSSRAKEDFDRVTECLRGRRVGARLRGGEAAVWLFQGALPGPGEERDAGLRGAGLGEYLPGAWALGGMSASVAGAKSA